MEGEKGRERKKIEHMAAILVEARKDRMKKRRRRKG